MRFRTVTTNRGFSIVVLGVLLSLLAVGSTACNPGPRGARRGDQDQMAYVPRPEPNFRQARYASLSVPMPEIAEAEYVNDDELCMTCHQSYVKTFHRNVHRGQSCEKCHGPASRHLSSRGRDPDSILSFKKLSAPQKAEVCLKCHEQDACSPGAEWRRSSHAHKGVSCTDCHTSHYNVPPGTPSTELDLAGDAAQAKIQFAAFKQEDPPVSQEFLRQESRHLGALTPHVCNKCHSDLIPQQENAHPHQICGGASMDCTTCHDPHGKVKAETRTDLCLSCHSNREPTMAWATCSHARYGVACTDCHNPHPNQKVQPFVNIQHTNLRRSPKTPMSVNDPYVCYKCHADIYAKNGMPSHHPVKEGKMFCSDCHDVHGQAQDNLTQPTVNMVCYKCHADKQGPFTYEHPPVTENCSICHEPHGTVVNNLLKQPTTFLCLRCHSGHRTVPGHPGNAPLQDVASNPTLQRAFYSDCSQCHSQVHGSDLPSPHLPKAFLR